MPVAPVTVLIGVAAFAIAAALATEGPEIGMSNSLTSKGRLHNWKPAMAAVIPSARVTTGGVGRLFP